jgi:hypothetical protein
MSEYTNPCHAVFAHIRAHLNWLVQDNHKAGCRFGFAAVKFFGAAARLPRLTLATPNTPAPWQQP